jgi:hypothetical protein
MNDLVAIEKIAQWEKLKTLPILMYPSADWPMSKTLASNIVDTKEVSFSSFSTQPSRASALHSPGCDKRRSFEERHAKK